MLKDTSPLSVVRAALQVVGSQGEMVCRGSGYMDIISHITAESFDLGGKGKYRGPGNNSANIGCYGPCGVCNLTSAFYPL